MSFENIFHTPKSKRVTIQYNADGDDRILLRIDATRAEEYSLTSQATDHEVEDGSDISDHIIKKGRRLTIEGTISDTPINLTQAMVGNVAGIMGSSITGAVGTVATIGTIALSNRLFADDASKPSKTAFDIFNSIYEASPPLTIITGITTYSNMIMESFSAPRNSQNANALEFKAVFKEIKIVSAKLVAIDVPRSARENSVKDLSARNNQLGKKLGAQLDGTKIGKGASWASKITGIK